jgi:hypothetical protein
MVSDPRNATMTDRMSTQSYQNSHASAFPKTSNQDFHNHEVFTKAWHIGNRIDKTNFKKPNVFSSYVNAMFNSGVFSNPW